MDLIVSRSLVNFPTAFRIFAEFSERDPGPERTRVRNRTTTFFAVVLAVIQVFKVVLQGAFAACLHLVPYTGKAPRALLLDPVSQLIDTARPYIYALVGSDT